MPSLRPHSPEYFSLTIIPHQLNPATKPHLWMKFLDEMLPDKELQKFLQEWFGYNLIHDSSYHKFVLLVGEGANGKSVVCVVLRTLLGERNISSVGLEQFNPTRTFPIASMAGKLANIVEELSEFDKASEGLLKTLSSGGNITIERKHRDPFETCTHPHLTFATNILPSFRDRSDGLWRRMIVIPFTTQILDTTKQNTNLVNSNWWIESGEIVGVLNWALEGLKRLTLNKSFTVPSASEKYVEKYKNESNPTQVFIKDNCKYFKGKVISTKELYQSYSEWMRERGNYPLNEINFSREVKRVFPYAGVSKNPRHIKGNRTRIWENLQVIQ